MNRMIGFGDACTSSITCCRRFSNSPFMLAPACSSADVERAAACTFLSGGGTSPAAIRSGEAFDDGRFADAGFAGEDRIVLPAAHEDVDDLANLLIAADDRIDLAFCAPVR